MAIREKVPEGEIKTILASVGRGPARVNEVRRDTNDLAASSGTLPYIARREIQTIA